MVKKMINSLLHPKKQLTIQLLEPIIYLRQVAGSNDTISNVIRGDVVLNLSKPMLVRSIMVRFIGKARTLWPEGVGKDKRLYDEETIHDQSIVLPLPHFMNADAKSASTGTEIPAGKHSFPFEILLPSSMVESIDADHGIVQYKIHATVEKVGMLSPTLYTRREVLLIRVPDESVLLGDSIVENSITGHRSVEGILDYTVTVLTKHPIPGKTLPVSINIQALTKGLRIEKINAAIAEKRVYESKFYGVTRVENKDLKLTPVDSTATEKLNVSLDQLGGLWGHEVSFKMPNCTDKLHCRTTYKLIRITHWIKFKLFVSFDCPNSSEREYRSYTLEAPIDILSCRLVPEYVALPRYENLEGAVVVNGFYCPCDTEYNEMRSSGAEFEYESAGSPPPPSYEDILKGDSEVYRVDSGHYESGSAY